MDEIKQLYTKYYRQIYKYLFYISGDELIAEELTQETFFQAVKSIHSFEGKSKISTWLFQIAKFTFYNYLKNSKNARQVTELSLIENNLPDKETPENIYEKKEELASLLNALKKLKQPYQEIIILRSYNELSFKEIGDIFNQSDTWARVSFYRAKNKLPLIIDGGDEK